MVSFPDCQKYRMWLIQITRFLWWVIINSDFTCLYGINQVKCQWFTMLPGMYWQRFYLAGVSPIQVEAEGLLSSHLIYTHAKVQAVKLWIKCGDSCDSGNATDLPRVWATTRVVAGTKERRRRPWWLTRFNYLWRRKIDKGTTLPLCGLTSVIGWGRRSSRRFREIATIPKSVPELGGF